MASLAYGITVTWTRGLFFGVAIGALLMPPYELSWLLVDPDYSENTSPLGQIFAMTPSFLGFVVAALCWLTY